MLQFAHTADHKSYPNPLWELTFLLPDVIVFEINLIKHKS